jgi:hypothetical protein
LGDRGDRENVFHREGVVVNLPGTWDYDPTRPRLYKIRWDGNIAGDLVIYIDDVRVVANALIEAWKASSRVAKDAARKRREPSKEPGAWAGTVMWATDLEVRKMVTQERWEKTKSKLDWIWRASQGEHEEDVALECPEGHIPHKKIESIRGFLVYVARTYPTMVPYLKGIHLTLDSWRVNRGSDGWPVDDDGWRISNTIDNKLEDADARQGGGSPANFCKKGKPIDGRSENTEVFDEGQGGTTKGSECNGHSSHVPVWRRLRGR